MFARDSETLYVSNRDGNSVSIVSKIDDQWSLVDTVPVGDAPIKLALNPTGTELYVGNYSGGTVSIVDTASRSLVGTVVLPQGDSIAIPTGLDVSTDAKRLYVATSNGDFHVIDTAAQNIATTLNTSATPVDLVFNHSTACGHMPSPFGQDGLSIVCVSAEGQIFVDGFESGDVSAWTLEE